METWSQTVFEKGYQGTRPLAHMLLKATAQDLAAAIHEAACLCQAPSQMYPLSPPSQAPDFSHIGTWCQCQETVVRHQRILDANNVITNHAGTHLRMSSLLCEEEDACENTQFAPML